MLQLLTTFLLAMLLTMVATEGSAQCVAPFWVPPDEVAVRTALKKPFPIEFKKTPLSKVASVIESTFDINVELDTRALDGVGLSTDEPVTFTSRGVSLESSLRLLLSKFGIIYIIDAESLLITTPDSCEATVCQMCDITELLTAAETEKILLKYDPLHLQSEMQTLIQMIQNNIAVETWDDIGGPGSINGYNFGGRKLLFITNFRYVNTEIWQYLNGLCNKPAKPPATDQTPRVAAYPLNNAAAKEASDLVRIIQTMIASDTWGQENTAIDTAAGSIIVRQSPAVQAEISKLLNAMGVLSPNISR